MKKALVIFFIFCFNMVFSQKIELKGKVVDENKKPVEAATIYLSNQKDSTLINYTISDVYGNFRLDVKSINQPSFLTVSYLGFDDFSEKLNDFKESKDFGTITLKNSSEILEEIFISTDAAPIRVKKDTLEFNAASFKVRPDATVKELLEQLPGFEVDAEGKIKVNGKEVNNVTVNGKPFFGADGKIAIENLPKDIINKVQVTDTKSKEEKFTGTDASGKTKTLNLTIDDDKNKGLFGRFIAGYGSNERYESSLLFNYFKNDFKISVLGSSNNINSTGFSTNEIFDNMSGGRNSFRSFSSDGSMSINGLQFGGGKGIYQTDMIGLNYGDTWGKNNKVVSSYVFNEIENNNENKSRIENLLPNNKYVTESTSKTRDKGINHSFNFEIEMEIDSSTTLTILPSLKNSNTKSFSEDFSESYNEFGNALNKSQSVNSTEVDIYGFNNELMLAKRFKRKGRSFSFTMKNDNSKNETNQLKNSAAYFYQTQAEDDIRNQRINSRSHKDAYNFKLAFREPIAPMQTLLLGYETEFVNEYSGRSTFDYNANSNNYDDYNTLLSYGNILNGVKSKPVVGYSFSGKKFRLSFNTSTTFNNYNVYSQYNQQYYVNERLDVLPEISTNFSFNLGETKSIYVSYDYDESSPYLHHLLEYEDLSSPLYKRKGNPNLKTQKSHSGYLSFNNYNYQSRSGYYLYFGGNYDPRSFGNSSLYDANFVNTSEVINIYDTYRSWGGLNYNKSFNVNEKTKLSVNAGFSVSSSLDRGNLNSVIYSSNTFNVEPEIKLTFDFDKKFTLQPTYSYDYNTTKYKNFTLDQANYFVHKAGLMLTSYLPKQFVIGSDVNYNYNSNISDGFKKDFLLWNASLGYNFYKDRFLAKVKMYDILNQNQSVRRYVSPTSIYDTQDIILKQYVMFSLTYKLEKFAGKKKSRYNFDE